MRPGQNGMRHKFAPTPEEELKSWNDELKAYRGDYRGIVKFRTGQLVFIQTFAVIFFTLYMAIGRMLIGMGLMKLGVFSGDAVTAILLVDGCDRVRGWHAAHDL